MSNDPRLRLSKAQRALARTQKGSARRQRARQRVSRLHHEVAVRRSTALHALTKQLATRFAVVAVKALRGRTALRMEQMKIAADT
ncbi:transposase [Streptomyces sp. NPDC092129]|uniref:transposase n=1 Tax=Streptomyces sp. NPDC092129 TaxID=3366010 RepID=UPI0037FA89B6